MKTTNQKTVRIIIAIIFILLAIFSIKFGFSREFKTPELEAIPFFLGGISIVATLFFLKEAFFEY